MTRRRDVHSRWRPTHMVMSTMWPPLTSCACANRFARCSRWPLTTWLISRTGLMTWWPCRIRTAVLDVKITIQATEYWHDRFESESRTLPRMQSEVLAFTAASHCWPATCFGMSTLDRCNNRSPQKLSQNSVYKFWGNWREACDT